jgi:PTH2 family peptidyl-tRNA hydrolase
VIERGDIEMPPGKLASQAIHASRLSLLKYLSSMPAHHRDAAISDFIALNTCGSAICLRAKNLDQILKARDQAEAAGLPWALFSDSGHILPPHFTGEPIITCLAIGPAARSAIHPITKKFRCSP